MYVLDTVEVSGNPEVAPLMKRATIFDGLFDLNHEPRIDFTSFLSFTPPSYPLSITLQQHFLTRYSFRSMGG